MVWDILQLMPNILAAYTNIIPSTIFWGSLMSSVVVGMWLRTRSVKLATVTFLILSPLVMVAGTGVSWGVPLAYQQLGQLFLALALAGIILYIIKK